MRKQNIGWTLLVIALVMLGYGGFSTIQGASSQKGAPALGIVLLVIGSILVLLFLVLGLINIWQKKKKTNAAVEEKAVSMDNIEPIANAEPAKAAKDDTNCSSSNGTKENSRVSLDKKPATSVYDDDDAYEPRPVRRSGGTGYVRVAGRGMELRISGNEILDMRSNTYYSINGNMVTKNGSGPAFEINGNRIRKAFGDYLFEISGNHVNKIYGGHFASISGGYLKTDDGQWIIEIPGSLSLTQQLAVVALLFGRN